LIGKKALFLWKEGEIFFGRGKKGNQNVGLSQKNGGEMFLE